MEIHFGGYLFDQPQDTRNETTYGFESQIDYLNVYLEQTSLLSGAEEWLESEHKRYEDYLQGRFARLGRVKQQIQGMESICADYSIQEDQGTAFGRSIIFFGGTTSYRFEYLQKAQDPGLASSMDARFSWQQIILSVSPDAPEPIDPASRRSRHQVDRLAIDLDGDMLPTYSLRFVGTTEETLWKFALSPVPPKSLLDSLVSWHDGDDFKTHNRRLFQPLQAIEQVEACSFEVKDEYSVHPSKICWAAVIIPSDPQAQNLAVTAETVHSNASALEPAFSQIVNLVRYA